VLTFYQPADLAGACDLIESEPNAMLRADIFELQRRQKILESEISEALCRFRNEDSIVTDLRSRFLFISEEIERLREQAAHVWHRVRFV
jgi:hypothetical protein